MFIVYVQRRQIDSYKCIDSVKTANIERPFESGGLLYGYTDPFNVVAIEKEMIISIDGIPGEYARRHGSYTEMTDNFSTGV